MEKVVIVKGVVEKLERWGSQYQGGDRRKIYRFHVASLLINGRWIRFEAFKPLEINQGDRVAIAAVAQGRRLDALACRNFTTGTMSDTGKLLWLMAGIAFTGAGAVFCLFAFLVAASGKGIVPILGTGLGACVFFLFGGLTFYAGIRTIRAVADLRKERAP